MRKFFAKLHLWLSIPLGLIITLVCFTGAILVFDTEISETIYSERYFVDKVGRETIPLDKLIPVVNQQLEKNSVSGVQVPSDPNRNYVMNLTEGRRISAYVNPYTGKVVEVSSFTDTFFGKVMGLHRWLLFATREVGKNIVGYSTLLFVIILITGVAIWWPKSKKQLKNRLAVKTGIGHKRFFYDSHVSLGFYLSIGLLVLALTGLTWSFDWYRKVFYNAFGVKMEQRAEMNPSMQARPERGQHPHKNRGEAVPESRASERPAHGPKQEEASQEKGEAEKIDYSQWQKALNNVKSKVANYRYITVSDGGANVAAMNQYGNTRAVDKYSFDTKKGDITEAKLYADAPNSSKIRGWIYSVHVGSWGGITTKILTFLIALIGGSLPLTGYYIYFMKRKKRWKRG